MKMDVQEELAVMKDELKNIKMGSGSTVCNEDSTDSGSDSALVRLHGHALFLLGMRSSSRGRRSLQAGLMTTLKSGLQGIADEQKKQNFGCLRKNVAATGPEVD